MLTIGSVCMASGLRIINTGLGGQGSAGRPEGGIAHFAALQEDPKADLPTSFTICSSVSTMAFTSALVFFQVQKKTGNELPSQERKIGKRDNEKYKKMHFSAT